MTNNLVQFNNNQLKVIESNNQRCLTATDIAKALGFEKVKSVSNIYTRHADEFDGLSWVINLMTETQSRHNRVFNREGAWLIGMFARTPKAAEFRKWVLKVLGAVSDGQLQPAPVDMRAIGGVVKKCAAVAVRDELKAVIHDEFEYFVMRIFACAENLKPFQEVTDDMLLRGLYDWYSTKHHEHIKAIKDLTAENDRLKSKMAEIRKTAAE